MLQRKNGATAAEIIRRRWLAAASRVRGFMAGAMKKARLLPSESLQTGRRRSDIPHQTPNIRTLPRRAPARTPGSPA